MRFFDLRHYYLWHHYGFLCRGRAIVGRFRGGDSSRKRLPPTLHLTITNLNAVHMCTCLGYARHFFAFYAHFGSTYTDTCDAVSGYRPFKWEVTGFVLVCACVQHKSLFPDGPAKKWWDLIFRGAEDVTAQMGEADARTDALFPSVRPNA